MKKIIIVLIALTTTLVSMTILTDLYTRDQIDDIVESVCSSYKAWKHEIHYKDGIWQVKNKSGKLFDYEYSDQVEPIHLFSFLYSNIYAMEPAGCGERTWGAGDLTANEYKNGWRKILAKNPSLAYKALDIYGETAIRQINLRVNYKATITNSSHKGYQHFTTQKFWIAQTTLIRRYHNLIDELLVLSDRDLNYYISSNTIYDAAVSYDFQKWLEKKNLVITSNPRGNGWEEEKSNICRSYPGDLLLLTKRIYEDYPEWTPRKFLTEAKKFSNKVLEIIEDNN